MSDTFDHEIDAQECQRDDMPGCTSDWAYRNHQKACKDNTYEMLDFKFTEKLAETDNAWYLKFKNGRAHWFPKSRCVITYGKDQANISVPRWLSDKKGL